MTSNAEMLALLQEIQEQEATLVFTHFTNDDALALGLRFIEGARAEGKAITIDITRHGHQLFHYALEGTSPDNDLWIQRKNRVVQHFGHSSYYVGTELRSKGKTIEEASLLDGTIYAAHGGAFPIRIAGVGVVGTITVSGLPQAEDHALAVRIIGAYLAELAAQ